MKILGCISIMVVLLSLLGCGTTGGGDLDNDKPQIIKETLLFPDKTVEEYTFYTYNKAHNTLLGKERFDADNKLIESTTYKYSGIKLTKKTSYDSEKNVAGYHVYTCSPAGLILTDITYNYKNEIQSRSIYQYNSKGSKIKWEVFNGAEGFLGYTDYIYDRKGNNIKIENYNLRKILAEYFTMEYNEKNLLIKTSSYANNKLYESIAYSYDAGGKLKDEVFLNAANMIVRKDSYSYSGNKMTITHYDSRGTRVTGITIREYNKKL